MEEITKPEIAFVKLENTKETAEACEETVKKYQAWVEQQDEESLKKEEQDIIAIIEEHENFLKNKEYPLGKKVEFDGKIYAKAKVAQFIRDIINKREVEYSFTLGLYQMYKYWENPGESIPYPTLDSTIRTLENGGTKFRGVNEWEKILVINEYFKTNNQDMTTDYLESIYYAHLHNAIITRLQLIAPVENEEGAVQGDIQMD